MPYPLEKKILVGFSTALVVVLLAVATACWSLVRFQSTAQLVDHTHRVLNCLEQSVVGILAMQTSARGFVITGRDELLAPYRAGDIRVTAALTELNRLTADNPAQRSSLARLAPHLARVRESMTGRIAARRAHGLAAAEDSTAFLAGQEAVEGFRHLIEAMETEERRLLGERLAQSQSAGVTTVATMATSGTIAAGLVIFAGMMVNRDFHRRRCAEDTLRELNEQLEARVADRTASLATANLGLTREVAERRRVEDSLRSSEQRLQTTLDGMLEGCQILSPELRYLYLNDTAAHHNRRHRQELLGHTMPECYPGIERTAVYHAILRCLDDRTTARLEQPYTFPDGTVAWFLVSLQPAPEGVTILSLDITDQKVSEERIRQVNATLEHRVRERTAQLEAVNRELEAFTYSVSHDLRAPLRHIDGFTNLLLRNAGPTLDATSQRHLGTISNSARQMGRLIDDLLAFSRIGRSPLHLETIDSTSLISAVVAEGRYQQPGRSLLWAIAPLPAIRADLAMLRQVWFNLIDNAVKYSGKNLHPKISISCRTDPTARELIFSVADNGVGFDPRYTDKLFGVFQRLHGPTEFEGTGIGLANVRRIIARHGGRTWAEGRVGEGATFYFSLPDVSAPEPSAS